MVVTSGCEDAAVRTSGSGDGRRPTIVCICGSTRHRDAIHAATRSETLAGRIVLAPGVFSQADGVRLDDDVVAALTDLHDAKIALADEVLVVDVDGIGEATAREIARARTLGRPVRYWSP